MTYTYFLKLGLDCIHYGRYVCVYDWAKWRGNFIRAAFDAQHVGEKVCGELAGDTQSRGAVGSLHAIGISVGAFAADSCIQAFHDAQTACHGTSVDQGAQHKTHVMTRLTLLDPFTSKGVFGYGWGINNFGKSADVVEDYLNTDDPVPSTNTPLRLAYTYDITSSEDKKKFEPLDGESAHSWPGDNIEIHILP